MDIGLQYHRILGFRLVLFSILSVHVQMMWYFELCCYFYLVLVKLVRQNVEILHNAGVPMVYTIVLIGQFLYFYLPCNRGGIGSDQYIWKYSLFIIFFSFLSRHNTFWILLVNFIVGSFVTVFVLPSCSSIFLSRFFFWQYYKFWTFIEWINFCVSVVFYCLCDFERLYRRFILKFLLRMWLSFWRRHSSSISLLLFSKSIAHVQ